MIEPLINMYWPILKLIGKGFRSKFGRKRIYTYNQFKNPYSQTVFDLRIGPQTFHI